jgi:hypothetical protein
MVLPRAGPRTLSFDQHRMTEVFKDLHDLLKKDVKHSLDLIERRAEAHA